MKNIKIPISIEKEFVDISEPFEYVYPQVQEIGGVIYKHISDGIYQPESPVLLRKEAFEELSATYCDLTFHVKKTEEYYDEEQRKFVLADADSLYTIYFVSSHQMALYDKCFQNLINFKEEFAEVRGMVEELWLDEICWQEQHDGEKTDGAIIGLCRFRQVDTNNRYQGYLKHIQFDNKIGYLIEPGIYYFGEPEDEERLWSHRLIMNLNRPFEKELAVVAYGTDFHPTFDIAVEYMAIDKKNFARLKEIQTTRNGSFYHEFPVKRKQNEIGDGAVPEPEDASEYVGQWEAFEEPEAPLLPEVEPGAVEIVEGIGMREVRLGYQSVFAARVPVQKYELAYFLEGKLVLYKREWKRGGERFERKELDLRLLGELVVRIDVTLKCGMQMERDIKVLDCKSEKTQDVLDAGELTFKKLRQYLSRTDRFSICMEETLEYKNYVFLKNVPDIYDDLYVHGIGMIESEFYKVGEYGYAASGDRENLTWVPCLEVLLSEKAKVF